jgi:hypothetical protein
VTSQKKSPSKPSFFVRFVKKIETNEDGTLKVSGTKGVPFDTLEEAQQEVWRGIDEEWRQAGWIVPNAMGKPQEAIWGTQRAEATCCPQPETHRLRRCPAWTPPAVAKPGTPSRQKNVKGGHA